MKKTFTINIKGTLFHIEEDAYEMLKSYMSKLKSYFGSDEDGSEILDDIEVRIAEILLENSLDHNQVITTERVEQIIAIMGTPDDFTEEQQQEDEKSEKRKKRKRFYRDYENRVFGGVCGGLAAYFNIDPVIVRVIFVVLFLITSILPIFLTYIILWIAAPKAVTTAQKLEMRGQEATIKNIEKSIREEIKEVKESYNNLKKSNVYDRGKKGVKTIGNAVGKTGLLALRILIIILGIILLVAGFFGLLGLISTLMFGESFMAGWPFFLSPKVYFPEFLHYFIEPSIAKTGIFIIGFIVGIPLLIMLYTGSKILFRYRSNNTVIGVSLIGIWIISLIALIVVSVGQLSHYKNIASVVESHTLQYSHSNTLYLQPAEDKYKDYATIEWDLQKMKIMKLGNDQVILGQPRLNIEKAYGDDFILTVKKSSRGKTRKSAGEHASIIKYNFYLTDTLLILDPYFFLDQDEKWRDQELFLTLKIPEGKTIFLDERMKNIIRNIDNISNTRDSDMIGKYWEMKPEGLSLQR